MINTLYPYYEKLLNRDPDMREVISKLENKLHVHLHYFTNAYFRSPGKGPDKDLKSVKLNIQNSYQYFRFNFNENNELINVQLYLTKNANPTIVLNVAKKNLNTIIDLIYNNCKDKLLISETYTDENEILLKKYFQRLKSTIKDTYYDEDEISFRFLPINRKSRFENEAEEDIESAKEKYLIKVIFSISENKINAFISYFDNNDEQIEIPYSNLKESYSIAKQKIYDLAFVNKYGKY